MQAHQHTDGERGSTIFDRKVRVVATRLGIPMAQVREVFAAYDAISMEWAHTDQQPRSPGQDRLAERGAGSRAAESASQASMPSAPMGRAK